MIMFFFLNVKKNLPDNFLNYHMRLML